METKLTLRLESKVIEQAKKYANKKHTSVSKLVWNYLESIVYTDKGEQHISPLVKSLSRVINLKKGADYKKTYKKHLESKYRRKNG